MKFVHTRGCCILVSIGNSSGGGVILSYINISINRKFVRGGVIVYCVNTWH